MKRFFLALAMAGILSSAALAGTIDTCGAPSPGDIPMTEPSPADMPTCGMSVVLTILDLVF